MRFATRLSITGIIWLILSLGVLNAQPYLDIGNWEGFIFPIGTAVAGFFVLTGIKSNLFVKIIVLASFCAMFMYLHLFLIQYFYVKTSDFINEGNWGVYVATYKFFVIVSFLVSIVVMTFLSVLRSRRKSGA